MKRAKLMQHLRKHGCELVREGARHSIWRNPGVFSVFWGHGVFWVFWSQVLQSRIFRIALLMLDCKT
jgi:hypothetical protein